jgi:hypothetical protein
MKPTQKLQPQQETPAEPEIQQSGSRSIAVDERLKRVIKQHPQRDEPKVDRVEPDETPPP